MPEFAGLLLCPQESEGRRMLCGLAGLARGFIPFPLTCVPLPASPALLFPCVFFSFFFFLSFKTRVQRINIPWLVNGILDPASGHWSTLPILLGATAGKHRPMGTVQAPETLAS